MKIKVPVEDAPFKETKLFAINDNCRSKQFLIQASFDFKKGVYIYRLADTFPLSLVPVIFGQNAKIERHVPKRCELNKSKLRAILQNKGWSVPQLAKKAGLPYHTVRKLFTFGSTRFPRPETLSRTCRTLGISPKEVCVNE